MKQEVPLIGSEPAAMRQVGAESSDIPEHALFLRRYARSFRSQQIPNFHFLLKERHTLGVVRAAMRIAEVEPCFAPPDMRRSVLLAAMYHDIARFPQIARFGTFNDAESFNHGRFGCAELKRLGVLKREEGRVRTRVLAAVCKHNSLTLPDSLPEDIALVCHAVRDADKLDILRVMRGHIGLGAVPDPVVVLGRPNTPGHSSLVLDAVRAGQAARYADMVTVNDMRLLMCSWFWGLHFPSSKAEAVRGGHLRSIVDALPDQGELGAFAADFRRVLDG